MKNPFLGRFLDLMPIRARPAFQVLSARRLDDQRACTLVLGGPRSDPRRVAEAFAEVERVQDLFSHPRVARVAARGEADGQPWLELDCPAVVDGLEVTRMFADAESRVPYGAADAFMVSLREAMTAAHAVTDPRTGRPICLGRLSPASTLFSADGEWWLAGFGRGWPLERDDGAPDGTVPFFQAPERWTGADATPPADYVALVLFVRSMLPFLEITGPIARVLRGDVTPADAELIDCLRWPDLHMLGQLPALRPTVADAVKVADRVREIAGVTLDRRGFAAHVASLIRRTDEPARMDGDAPAGPQTVTVAPDGSWLAGPDGARFRLGRGLRGIVLALLERHRADPESALTTHELLEAGWPGEQPVYEAGLARVYVAVNRLRRMGLREVIERFESGYRLVPSTRVISA